MDGGTLEMDRLSSLPDAVLCHILSLLPTKYSARTTALSTRWKYLFVSIPIIHCDDIFHTLYLQDQNKNLVSTLIPFVTRTLCLITNRLSHITKFRFRFQRHALPISLVSFWIIHALRYNVRKIDFYSVVTKPGPLPRDVFTSRTLVTLKLGVGFVLSVTDHVFLPNLKKLGLGDEVFSDEESIKNLFSGCPVLEVLGLSCKMAGVKSVEISLLSLKRLSLHVRESCDYRVMLNTPNLEYFYCTTYASMGYFGDPPSSLKEAFIDVVMTEEEYTFQTKTGELLDLMSETRFLLMNDDVLEALMVSDCLLPMFGKLTSLELINNLLIGWEILPGILEASPHLELLDLKWGSLDEGVGLTGFTFSKPEKVPKCLSLCLKKVNIKKFFGDESEYEFIEYLLRNCEVLEEIIVRKNSRMDWGVELSDSEEKLELEEYFEMSRKLLSFPRRSKVCRIVFDEEVW